jgi:hypothetical protein
MNSHDAMPRESRPGRDRRSDDQVQLLDDDQVQMLDDERRGTPDKKGSPFDRPTDPGDERWQQIQADFVDDPRRSLAAAQELAGELIESIIRDLKRERDSLNQQWSDDEVSTEDMRVCFQRYREFYHQLLFRSARSGWEAKV